MEFNYVAFNICKWIILSIVFLLLISNIIFMSITKQQVESDDLIDVILFILLLIFYIGLFICTIIFLSIKKNPDGIDREGINLFWGVVALVMLIFSGILIALLFDITIKKLSPAPSPAPAQQIARSFQLPKTFQLPATKPPMFQLPDLNGVYSELTRLKDQFNIAKE